MQRTSSRLDLPLKPLAVPRLTRLFLRAAASNLSRTTSTSVRWSSARVLSHNSSLTQRSGHGLRPESRRSETLLGSRNAFPRTRRNASTTTSQCSKVRKMLDCAACYFFFFCSSTLFLFLFFNVCQLPCNFFSNSIHIFIPIPKFSFILLFNKF